MAQHLLLGRAGALLMVVACSGDKGGSDTGGTNASDAQDWSWTDTAAPATATAAELEESLASLVSTAVSISARPVLQSYYEAMTFSEDVCPAIVYASAETTGDVSYWDGLCEASTGVTFKGPMTTWDWADIDLANGEVDMLSSYLSGPGQGYTFTGQGIRGQTDIYDDTSEIDFNCSCIAMMAAGRHTDGTIGSVDYLDGPSHWTGSASEGTWLEDDLRVNMVKWATLDPAGKNINVNYQGGITGLPGRFDTAKMDAVLSWEIDSELGCKDDGFQTISLRLRDGETAEWSEPELTVGPVGEACMACMMYDGEEVCVDVHSLITEVELEW